jgi:hypothetical protein
MKCISSGSILLVSLFTGVVSLLRNKSLRRYRWILLLVLFVYLSVKFVIFLQRINVMDESLDLNGCPKSAIFLDDGGRMGNQFFEYLQAKIISRQANRGLFIRRVLFDKFSSYFNGPSNRTFESVKHLKQVCGKKLYKDFAMGYQIQLPRKLRKQPYIIFKRNYFDHKEQANF